MALPQGALFQHGAPTQTQTVRTTRHVDTVTGSTVLARWNDPICHRCAGAGGPHGPVLKLIERGSVVEEWQRELDWRVTWIRDLVAGEVFGYEPKATYVRSARFSPEVGQYDYRKVAKPRTVDEIRALCDELAVYLRDIRQFHCFECKRPSYPAGLQLVEIKGQVSLWCRACRSARHIGLWRPWKIPRKYRIGTMLFTPADAFRLDAAKKRRPHSKRSRQRRPPRLSDDGVWRARVIQQTVSTPGQPPRFKRVSQRTRLGRE